MSDPYRGSAGEVPVEAPRDQGIVGDVIAQFADTHAFYRELVQNAIDAGSPNIEIRLTYDRAAQRMHVSVRDRGTGMTRDIVENQLLVLFRSTKEKDRTKIGKFGIGFASVLAPNPEVVVVQTSRDGRRITLHLYRDLSYELFDSGPATQTGTTVEIEIAIREDDVPVFIASSNASLIRWCRHASVPIELSIDDAGNVTTTRIDRPLALESALVEVRRTSDDGQRTAVVGIQASTPYSGFFNHGLMLYESNQPVLDGVSFKIQDTNLGHTLSRDDVRRDEHFDNAVAFARAVAEKDLPKAAAAKLHALAEAADLANHEALVAVLLDAKMSLDASDWVFPLVEPIEGKRTIAANRFGRRAWACTRSNPVTATLAAGGIPVIHTTNVDLFAVAMEKATGCLLADVDLELTAVTPIPRTPADDALLALLGHILDSVHRKPRALVLAKLVGVRDDRLAIAATSDRAHVVDRDESSRDPFALLQRRPLVLSVDHSHVQAARNGAPHLAACHLARAVLLQYGHLNRDRSYAILEHALGGADP